MQSGERFTDDRLFEHRESFDQLPNSPADRESPVIAIRPQSMRVGSSSHSPNPMTEDRLAIVATTSAPDHLDHEESQSITLADFVERHFIPDYVEIKRSAGRAHFRAILKHVLTPDQVVRAFGETPDNEGAKREGIPGWPYIGSLPLSEIEEGTVQRLISTALAHGYSIQTATHIRNVIRAIFSHAIRTRHYSVLNPAAFVTLPAMSRKIAHTLSLAQLKQVMPALGYPEKGIALLALLTEMNVAEICGLQWQYVNLSNDGIELEDDWLPAKTIAVRNQWYRGELAVVVGSRKRLVPVPDLLCSTLRDLKDRKQFTRPQDFVLTSRNGTPVYPENIAARRLKSVGKAHQMPWLSWYVFHRTHLSLRLEFGRHLHTEYERVLSLRCC